MVNITKDQTSNAPSATSWSSIHLVEQNVIAETSDLLSCRYILQWAGDSSNILQSTWSMLLMSHPRFGYSDLEGSMKIMQEIRMSNHLSGQVHCSLCWVYPCQGDSPYPSLLLYSKFLLLDWICFLKKSWIVTNWLNNIFFHHLNSEFSHPFGIFVDGGGLKRDSCCVCFCVYYLFSLSLVPLTRND